VFFRCNGGDHHTAIKFFIKYGVVTGGAYESDKGCVPYPIRPSERNPRPSLTLCSRRCQPEYTKNTYQNDKLFGQDQLTFSYANQRVMNELMKNGPLVAEFEMYEDFLNYSSGVYEHKNGQFLAYHYVKILGWG
jgi:cathepsin B